MIWALVTRSVFSRRRRTIFVVLSLSLSSFALTVGSSLLTSFRANIESGLRRGFVGDLQIYPSGSAPHELLAEVPAGSPTLTTPADVMKLTGDDPGVSGVSPRSSVSGMILVGDLSAPATLVGIDPVAESDLFAQLIPDNPLLALSFDGILLGRSMATRLRQDETLTEVTVLIPTADGLFEGDRFRVEGVYSPPGLPIIDEFITFVPLTRLQSLLDNEGYPGSLIVWLRDGADHNLTRNRLQSAFQAQGWHLDISTWEELAGNLLSMVRVGQYLIGSGFLLLLVVVVVGVGNAFLVLMLDRSHEIGLMKALGTSRLMIIGALLAEVALVSAAASAAGVLLGAGLCLALGQVGIPAASQAMAYAFGGDRFFPELHFAILIYSFLLVAVTGPVVAFAPAAFASAADPAASMRNPT